MRIAIAAAVLAFTAAGAALADPPVPTTRSETEQAAQDAAAPAAHSDSHDGMGHSDKTAPKTPQIMPGYGNGGFRITTRVPEAQAFFDNGMTLAHAFAHEAAVGAMKEAGRLDPACAMCLWGQAWADGPTINYGKSEAEIAPLAEMADRAAELAKTNGTDRERALIRALQLRYVDGGGGKPGDLAFAKAMTALAGRYPKDDEIAIMTADAWLMTEAADEQGWALNANLAMPFLESVLRRNPDSTGAIHFYIHATEIAGEPALAEEHADRLIALAPRASHLVHMPSHTYYWVGRYQDAADVNMRAVEIGIENARELGLPAPDGVWGLPYHAHNVTYGLGGALEAGDAKTALALARPLVERSQTRDGASAYSQLVGANGYLALAQFAPPEEILALPEPRSSILAAAWHYARGEARFRQGDAPGVRAEADALRGLTGDIPDDGSKQAQNFIAIVRGVLAGRTAMLEGRTGDAAMAYRQAAEEQESKQFSSVADPPAWHYPVRRDLAEALLAQGDRVGARREADAALAYRKNDPGTLALLRKIGSSERR